VAHQAISARAEARDQARGGLLELARHGEERREAVARVGIRSDQRQQMLLAKVRVCVQMCTCA